LQLQIKERGKTFSRRPDICRPRDPRDAHIAEDLSITVPDWLELRRRREFEMLQQYGATGGGLGGMSEINLRPLSRAIKTHKGKGNGRTYTSRYRGVHQTFPTRRWEAQFRRSGKPTSLGCFDHEEEAARAYDKMMLWCELHYSSGMKGGVTNFDPSNYEADIQWLQQVTQDELVQILRSDGRRQAAQRIVRQKKEPLQGVGPSAGREKELAGVSGYSSLAASMQIPSHGGESAGVSAGPSAAVSEDYNQEYQ
jgi:AP2 domain